MPAYTGYMAVGYTALLLDLPTQQMLREVYGATHAGTPVTTPRIVDKIDALRSDKREIAPEISIVGVHENAQIKVLLVEVNGAMKRADGGFYNIPLFMPERGLHIKTIDELAQALLLSVPMAALRNHVGAGPLAANPAFVVGVERPQAIVAEVRPQVAAKPIVSRFMAG